MNILVVCPHGLYCDLTSSFVHNQAKAYVSLGNRVRVLIPIAFGKRGPEGSRFQAGVRLKSADGMELYYVRYFSISNCGEHGFNTRSAIAALRPQLGKILKGFRPDVVHAHTFGLGSGIGVWLKKQLGCPLVVTTHGSDLSIPAQKGDFTWLRGCCENVDCIAPVSSVLEKKLLDCGVKTPMRVILNGFRQENLPASAQKSPFSVLQAGNLIPQKKTDVTIRAFSALRQKYPAASLTVVGSGPEQESLKMLCENLKLGESVVFTGRLPNGELLQQMAKTQFFVMPSVCEGFGIVYLEAMACGCVAIGTQGEGISDLIVSGKNGILVPPDDPEAIAGEIAACLEDPLKAAEMAEHGRKDARALTWEANAEKYLKLFLSLMQEVEYEKSV